MSNDESQHTSAYSTGEIMYFPCLTFPFNPPIHPLKSESQITRLHRDMADMLDSTSPMASWGASRSSGGGFHSRGRSDELLGDGSDSEDDFSDDPALGELRDSLRSSTERFFLRPPSQASRGHRRGSEVSPESGSRSERSFNVATTPTTHHSHHSSLNLGPRKRGTGGGICGLKHQTSVDGLSEWEKSIGSMMMRRSISKSTSCSLEDMERGGDGRGRRRRSPPTLIGEEGFIVRSLAGSARMGTLVYDDDKRNCSIDDDSDLLEGIQNLGNGGRVGGADSDTDDFATGISGSFTPQSSLLDSSKQHSRELLCVGPGGVEDGMYESSVAETTTPTEVTSRSARLGLTGAVQSSASPVMESEDQAETPWARVKMVLTDLWSHSEDTGRILEALKATLTEETASASTTPLAENAPGMKPIGSDGRRRQVDKLFRTSAPASRPEISGCEGGEPSFSAAPDAAASRKKGMPLLLLAMENVEHISAQVSQLLRESSSRRRASSPSPHERGARPHQWQRRRPRASVLPRIPRDMPRKSSALLQRRRSATGEVEPISCGVPRYRIQVGRLVDEVFYEVAITQARSTWTVERRLDEFVALRRALVATASKEAAVAAATAAGKRQRGSSGEALPGMGSSEVGTDRSDDGDVADGEKRVPELHVNGNSWLGNTSLGMMMSGRKREEVLTEKQVLLASWLANVLADPQLMSPDLVRFLGGSDGGVLTQPIIEEPIEDDTVEEPGGIDCGSEFTEFDECGDWPLSIRETRLGRSERGDVAKTPRRSTLAAVRATQFVPSSEGQSGSRDGEIVADRHADVAGVEGGTHRPAWRLEDGDGVGTAMFMSGTSPILSPRGCKAHDAPSPSSKRSTPPRQISVDAFFRAPT